MIGTTGIFSASLSSWEVSCTTKFIPWHNFHSHTFTLNCSQFTLKYFLLHAHPIPTVGVAGILMVLAIGMCCCGGTAGLVYWFRNR